MAQKSFQEVFDEIKSKVSVSNKGGSPRPVKSWSRSDFDRLAKALVNDVNYTIDSVTIKNGKPEKKEIKPVQLYRNAIRQILMTSVLIRKKQSGSWRNLTKSVALMASMNLLLKSSTSTSRPERNSTSFRVKISLAL